jgi:acetyl esterase/lipase
MRSVVKKSLLLCIAFALTACGGGGASSVPVTPTPAPAPNPLITDNTQQPASGEYLANPSFSSIVTLDNRASDARIEYGGGDLQYGELWLPRQNGQAVPLLIFLHGGCWSNQYRLDQSYGFASEVADNYGIAVWSLEYRSTGDLGGGWPGSYQDIVTALGKLSSLRNYGVDTSRVVLAGHSAGGHLALLAASQPEASQLKAVIGLASIVDFVAYAEGASGCQQAARAFIGERYSDNPDAYNAANPIGRTLLPRVVLMHGGRDTIVPIEHPRAAGFDVIEISEAGHFDWLHPETRGFARLLGELNSLFGR